MRRPLPGLVSAPVLARQYLLDIGYGIRRFAPRLTVIDFHLADPSGRSGGLFRQCGAARADADQRAVHRVADPVLRAVNIALDPGQQRFEVFIWQRGVVVRHARQQQPARVLDPLLVAVDPFLALLPG